MSQGKAVVYDPTDNTTTTPLQANEMSQGYQDQAVVYDPTDNTTTTPLQANEMSQGLPGVTGFGNYMFFLLFQGLSVVVIVAKLK